MDKIISYLMETYHPTTIIVYGSYHTETNNLNSDFDCLLICNDKKIGHDSSFIDGIELDAHIYTKNECRTLPLDEFSIICDSHFITDDGEGKILKDRVCEYVRNNSRRTMEEKKFIVNYIRKMLRRFKRDDEEARFRAVSLLNESLEDYYIFHDIFYFGPKKALKYIKENDSIGYPLVIKALNEPTYDNIRQWMEHIIKDFN